MKDVVSCDKLRVDAYNRQSEDFRMGQPNMLKTYYLVAIQEANLEN